MYGKVLSTVIAAVTILMCLLCSPCPARELPDAMSDHSISVRISPTYIVKEVRNKDSIGPVTVSNTGTVSLDIQGFVSAGSHDENGVPVFLGSSKDSNSHEGVSLILEPGEFTLKPGESKAVEVTAQVSPGFSGGAYPIIVFRGRPIEREPSSALNTSSQVGVLTLISVSSGGKQSQLNATQTLTSASLSQDPVDKSILVSVICENQGNIHTNLCGTAAMRYHDGRLASLTELEPAICLPGCKRIVSGRFMPSKLTKGVYIAEILLTAQGRAVPSVPVAFEVSDNGMVNAIHMDLSQPGDSWQEARTDHIVPRISSFSVSNDSTGYGLPVEVCLQNPYETDVGSIGYIEILDYKLERVGLMAFHGGTMPPGGTKTVRMAFDKPLPPGYYTAKVTLQMGNTRRHAHTAFAVAGSVSGYES